MSNTANNFVAGDWHATDVAGPRVQLKSTNSAGVHQLHGIDDALTPGGLRNRMKKWRNLGDTPKPAGSPDLVEFKFFDPWFPFST